MRVLLAGATGAIGSRVLTQLLEAGHEVTGLARRTESLTGTGTGTGAIAVDLLDRAAVLEAVAGRSFDAVIHQATDLHHPPTRYASMLRTNRLRSEGTSTLIAAAKATGATRFVTASIFYGYGFIDHGDELVTESEVFARPANNALDPVHLALASNEQQVHAFGGVSLRYGLFGGVGSTSPVVASDWLGLLPVVHLSDAAAAAVLALERGEPGQAYNIADEHPVSWRELQQASAIAAGRRLPALVPSWALRASAPFAAEMLTRTSIRLSSAKARSELGWVPRFASFADGLRESVEVEVEVAATT